MLDQRTAQWVADLVPACVDTAAKIKISPEAIVAQAALESGWGRSKVGAFGLFGVKVGGGWTGGRVLVRTREFLSGQWVTIDDWFRDYPSYRACIEDHFKFLDQNSRYRAAGVFDGKGDQHYFSALQRAGYATDPEYADKLMSILGMVKASLRVVSTVLPAVPAQVRTLVVGFTGADVAALQKALGIVADSQFGPVTQRAVMSFQKANGLVADGIVGPVTRNKLKL